MSYVIFTKCKYNKTTRNFDCASYSNNDWPRKANPWELTYFAEEYPDATDDELKAAFILHGLFSGDRFWARVAWAKKWQKIAHAWIDSIVARDGNDKAVNYHSIESARDLLEFYNKTK